jgi:hypothetical protein
MTALLIEKLQRAFTLYDDLLEFLPEECLGKKLGALPSITIGHQLWCVVGARHSYLKALRAGSWQGFECPLKGTDTTSSSRVADALRQSANEMLAFLEKSELAAEGLVIDLLEHEAQHQGQLIRYMYGLRLGVPKSWKLRYNLD